MPATTAAVRGLGTGGDRGFFDGLEGGSSEKGLSVITDDKEGVLVTALYPHRKLQSTIYLKDG